MVRSNFMRLTAGGLLAGATMAFAPQAVAQARSCDRTCLSAVMDGYLAALAARDPSTLRLDKSVKYTENGQRLNVGDGLWRTFSKGPLYRLDLVDPKSGQVAMLGILEENGNRNFFSLRLAVEENALLGRGLEITEIEMLINRSVQGGRPAAMALERSAFRDAVPVGKRASRGEMIALADAYFTGLDTDESAANVPFADTCLRIENGTITAANPNPPEGMAMAGVGCKDQFNTGFSTIVSDLRERRYPLVDEEKGLVLALGFFDHDGSVSRYTTHTGEGDVSQTFRQPFSFMISEVFQIRDHAIDQIEAVLMAVPYKMEDGW